MEIRRLSKPTPPPPKSERLLFFDLENRPSAYWYDDKTTSEITAFAWKWSDEREANCLLLRADGMFARDDGTHIPTGMAYVVFRDLLCQADLVVGHNIRDHDLRMLNGWFFRLQIPTIPRPLLTTDTARDLPKRKDLSYSLENLASLYDLPGKKFTMSQPMWEEANRLTDKGIELTRKRVVSDVMLQERLFKKLTELGELGPPKKWRPR